MPSVIKVCPVCGKAWGTSAKQDICSLSCAAKERYWRGESPLPNLKPQSFFGKRRKSNTPNWLTGAIPA